MIYCVLEGCVTLPTDTVWLVSAYDNVTSEYVIVQFLAANIPTYIVLPLIISEAATVPITIPCIERMISLPTFWIHKSYVLPCAISTIPALPTYPLLGVFLLPLYTSVALFIEAPTNVLFNGEASAVLPCSPTAALTIRPKPTCLSTLMASTLALAVIVKSLSAVSS